MVRVDIQSTRDKFRANILSKEKIHKLGEKIKKNVCPDGVTCKSGANMQFFRTCVIIKRRYLILRNTSPQDFKCVI